MGYVQRQALQRVQGELYTLGYAAPHALAELEQLREISPTAFLADTRLRPVSRYRPEWNKNALARRFGAAYGHFEGLGNVHYRDKEQPIQLLAPEKGVQHLAMRLKQGGVVVLLCACADYGSCHRKVVAELILHAMNQGSW